MTEEKFNLEYTYLPAWLNRAVSSESERYSRLLLMAIIAPSIDQTNKLLMDANSVANKLTWFQKRQGRRRVTRYLNRDMVHVQKIGCNDDTFSLDTFNKGFYFSIWDTVKAFKGGRSILGLRDQE